VTEALEVARRSGVRLHLAHFRTQAANAGKVPELMAPIDRAEAEGVDCTLDIYPYPTGSSIPISYLPSHAQEGGPEQIMRRLADPAESRKISDFLDSDRGWVPDEVVFTYLGKDSHLEGMSLPTIARSRGMSMGKTLCALLLDNDLKVGYAGPPPDSVALWRQMSRDSMELLARPDYMVCSDITPAGSIPHPRSYGAFPRFLGRLRRQFGGIGLEEMVHRMTDRPAQRFGLTRRGRIERGYFADVTIFDPERVIDTATYDDPRRFPVGIPYVLVNGQVAVDSERCTGALAGRAVP
jgi:N-acyl-D-amino-acid deacylase